MRLNTMLMIVAAFIVVALLLVFAGMALTTPPRDTGEGEASVPAAVGRP